MKPDQFCSGTHLLKLLGVAPPAPVIKAVSLKDLVGVHLLRGVDTSPPDEDKHVSWIRFLLDGKTYLATEDPQDGYRSSMQDLVENKDKVAHTFPAISVTGRMKTEPRGPDDYVSFPCDILQLVHAKTDAVLLEIGTNNTDDYYPSWVAWYDREALG